jgi:hypothetical protein
MLMCLQQQKGRRRLSGWAAAELKLQQMRYAVQLPGCEQSLRLPKQMQTQCARQLQQALSQPLKAQVQKKKLRVHKLTWQLLGKL